MSSSSSQKLTKYETRDLVPEEIMTKIIPEEIVENILIRLPVKSLSRFKCVSKPWLSLISSPRHLILIKDRSKTIGVVGSCNGLVCIYAGHGRQNFYIWNPCTGIFKTLPHVNFESKKFGRIKSTDFGYNALDDDYVVICLLITYGELELKIYSLRADSWKSQIFINSSIKSGEHLFFGGKIHIGSSLQALSHIIFFDLKTNVHGSIEQPEYGDGVEHIFLKELGGLFCVVCKKETHADLWVLREYGVKESWIKMLTVSFHDDPQKAVRINPLFILPSGEILVGYQNHLEVYNPEDNSTRVLDTSKYGPFVSPKLYVESLVSPTQHERMRVQEDE